MRVIDNDRLAKNAGQLKRDFREHQAEQFEQHKSDDERLGLAEFLDPRADLAKNRRTQQTEPQNKQRHFRQLGKECARRRSIVLEAQARISALQALIRPHFLFNSMNTIASLTRSDPSRAEEAIEDLADLLRANLGVQKDRTTLKEELEIAAIYQRIEKLRLGDRLNVHWNIGELPMRALIPSLTIQPLLENAIYHGIELLPEGGDVTVTGVRNELNLEIEMRNPVAADCSRKKVGNQMALANIRQRFELAYGGKATVSVEQTDDEFRVKLCFPYDEQVV